MADKKKILKSESNRLLLEIGVEELPLSHWRFVTSGAWEKLASDLFQEYRLEYSSLQINTTPRRIVFLFEGVSDKQKVSDKVHRGPSVDKAFDADGKPTKALQGFLQSKGVTLAKTTQEKTDKGTYIIARVSESSKKSTAIVPELLKTLIQKLPFSKNMRWEETGIRFTRPVRWLLSLYKDKVVPFEFAGVKTGNVSRGHRFLSPKEFKVKRIAEYEKLLKKNHVILNRKERRSLVVKQINQLAKKKSWNADYFDAGLVEEITDLVEEPFACSGSFDKSFLKLPSQVLSTCMKKNQKIFACFSTKGKLVPEFVAVLNGKRKNAKKVSADYQNVLESRLRDAQFFYQEDTREPLENKVSKLKGIVFLGKLGTVYEKTGRLKQLALFLSDSIGISEQEKQDLVRAAELCKADLVTSMVFEFPELQGVMGAEYATFSKERSEVAKAIDAHYWPKSLNLSFSALKKQMNSTGALLAIIEKLDTLVGAFGSGLIPTGSQDPYALRRACGGVVKTIRAFGFSFSLLALIEKAKELYGNKVSEFNAETGKKLNSFIKERLVYELEAKSGTQSYEILQAILETGFDDLSDVYQKFELLNKYAKKQTGKFTRAAKVVERTGRILKGVKDEIPTQIKKELLQENLEKQLFEVFESNEAQFKEKLVGKHYAEATEFYGDIFYEPIHQFFDGVLVNAEDQKVRANRQALLRKINSLYVDSVADLSCISNL